LEVGGSRLKYKLEISGCEVLGLGLVVWWLSPLKIPDYQEGWITIIS
jgi:hypothetical protein